MDQKSSKKLDDLPENENKEFWGNAEIHGNIVPQKTPFFDQPHHFVRKSGRSAQCTHCDWGFDLDAGDKIEDGHLFAANGTLVV